MPRRVIDFEAMWASDKLASCAEWAQAEYAWLYGLADANGSFELTNLRVIWGRVAAIRKNLPLERLEQIFDDFHDKGLLFIWAENGKRYGHWTNSELPGRLPSPSWRARLERLAPPVPAEQLAEYMRRFGGRDTLARPVVPAEAPAAHDNPSDANASPELKPALEATQTEKGNWDQNWDEKKEGSNTAQEVLPIEQLSQKPGNASVTGDGKASADRPAAAPMDPRRLLEIYEQERGPLLPAVRELTAQRLSKCRARLGARNFLLEDFRAAVHRAGRTPFLCGESERRWRASFDWFIANDTNYVKVLEGRYDAAPRQVGAMPASADPFAARSGVPACRDTRAGLGPILGAGRVRPEYFELLRQREEKRRGDGQRGEGPAAAEQSSYEGPSGEPGRAGKLQPRS